MSTRTGAAVVLLGIVLLTGGCGNSGGASPADRSPAPERSPAGASRQHGPQVFARDAQLLAGSKITLLRIPAGRLLASCSEGHLATRFTVGGVSADVVVRSGARTRSGTIPFFRGNRNLVKTLAAPPMTLPDIQTWSIAEFAEADVRPTIVTLAAMDGTLGTPFRCSVSALATVGAPTSTTTK